MDLFKHKKYENNKITESDLEKYYYLIGKRFKIDKTGIFTVVSVSISGNQIAVGFGGLSLIYVDELLNNDKCTEVTVETLVEEKSVDGLSNKPPIGIMPKYIWESKRQRELSDAINRYLEAALPVPSEWIEEYNELIKNT
jgi:hypothetical protein